MLLVKNVEPGETAAVARLERGWAWIGRWVAGLEGRSQETPWTDVIWRAVRSQRTATMDPWELAHPEVLGFIATHGEPVLRHAEAVAPGLGEALRTRCRLRTPPPCPMAARPW